MNLSQLLAALPPSLIISQTTPFEEQVIQGITSDSRSVTPDMIFVAYQGVNLDSHRFIPKAIAQGASVIISERELEGFDAPFSLVVQDGREALAYLSAAWNNYPARQLKMVGITGTDGKTTTTHFLYNILTAAQQKTGMINTVSAVIGDEALETGLHTTTPDSPNVQRFLAQMVAAKTELCLLETTSHGLAHHRVTACDFDIAIVTNITHEHLDLHGSLDGYRAAKASLFESLATAADKGQPKLAVLNCDDWSFEYLKAKLERNQTPWVGYSINGHPEATLTARDIHYRPDKTRFTICREGIGLDVETNLVGDYNVSNALGAVTAAWVGLSISPENIAQGLTNLAGIPGRMERINEGQAFMAVVDFAHTPNSLRRSLQVAKTLTKGRVIAVFGCAGLRDQEKRVMMGHIAAELADITIITAEDPRTENLDAIIAETAETMLADGAIEGETFERVPDRGQAIFRATQLAQPDDIVIALGKGHEQSMCFGEIEYPWDDRKALRMALRGHPLLTLPTA